MYSTEELLKLRESGKYPIVNLKIFDTIFDIKLEERTLDNIKYTEETYIERINTINSLEQKDNFLDSIKYMEVRDNQYLEKEDPLVIECLAHLYKDNCIDYLLNNELNKETFIKGHQILLEGTSSQEYSENEYRTNNDTYVSMYDENGNIHPYYFALDCKDIPEGIDKVVEYFNSNTDKDVFKKGIITHGLIAALQMFNDGNTRYARVLQYLKIKELTESLYNMDLKTPYIYGTKAYFPFKDNYRRLMSDLAINPDDDKWNDWINFNLNRIQDRMNYEEPRIEEVKILTKKK